MMPAGQPRPGGAGTRRARTPVGRARTRPRAGTRAGRADRRCGPYRGTCDSAIRWRERARRGPSHVPRRAVGGRGGRPRQPHATALRPLIEAGQVQICNHTYTHLDMLLSGDGAIRSDIERNEDWIQAVFGTTARPWLRPPFGRHSLRTDTVAGGLGYTRIPMWDGSFGDARLLPPQVWGG